VTLKDGSKLTHFLEDYPSEAIANEDNGASLLLPNVSDFPV